MKLLLATLIFLFLFCGSNAQKSKSYVSFLNDPSIEWASEYNTIANLTSGSVSLKKWYLQKIKSGTAIAFKESNDHSASNFYKLSMRDMDRNNDWLKNYSIQSSDDPKAWTLVNKTDPAERYFISYNDLSEDSCCGCDGSDAFLVKQIVYYQKGRLKINNAFISPLCARKTNDIIKWYPAGKMAFNNSASYKSDNARLIATNDVKYFIRNESEESFNKYSNLSGGIDNLISFLLRDIENGKVSAVDFNSGKKIPAHDLLKWNMSADTVIVSTAAGENKEIITQRNICKTEIFWEMLLFAAYYSNDGLIIKN